MVVRRVGKGRSVKWRMRESDPRSRRKGNYFTKMASDRATKSFKKKFIPTTGEIVFIVAVYCAFVCGANSCL